jgi:hypothetical protein
MWRSHQIKVKSVFKRVGGHVGLMPEAGLASLASQASPPSPEHTSPGSATCGRVSLGLSLASDEFGTEVGPFAFPWMGKVAKFT